MTSTVLDGVLQNVFLLIWKLNGIGKWRLQKIVHITKPNVVRGRPRLNHV